MKEIDLDYEKIVGTWKLKDFSLVNENGDEIIWHGTCHGHLIYTSDKFVSASINRVVDGERKDSFYFAEVSQISSNTVTHKILECQDPERIGRSYIRSISWKDGHLALSGNGPSGQIKIIWERVT